MVDISEAERQTFQRNLFLVSFDEESTDSTTSLRDVQQAWEYERTTLDRNAEGATPLDSEFALRGAELDGKSVADCLTPAPLPQISARAQRDFIHRVV